MGKPRKEKRAAKRVKLLKIEKVEPDKHRVELEIEGAPEPPPETPASLEEPLLVHAAGEKPSGHHFAKWLRGLFSGT